MADPVSGIAYEFHTGLFDMATPGRLKSNPTLTVGDFKLSKDGGSLANLATLPVVAPAAGPVVKIALSASELTGCSYIDIVAADPDLEWADALWHFPVQAVAPGQLTTTERNAIADALLDRTDGAETGVTVRQSLRLANAANGGKTDGLATSTVHVRDLADSKNRVTATVDADGNRTSVTRDLT